MSLHQAPHMIERGISPTVAATIVSAFSLAAVVSGIVFGYIGDRVQVRAGLAVSAALLALGAVTMRDVDGPLLGYISAVLFGAGIGGILTMIPVAWANYFGRAHFGAIRGITLPAQVGGQAIGPLAAGILHDLTGSYSSGLALFAVLSLLAAAGGACDASAEQAPARPRLVRDVAQAMNGRRGAAGHERRAGSERLSRAQMTRAKLAAVDYNLLLRRAFQPLRRGLRSQVLDETRMVRAGQSRKLVADGLGIPRVAVAPFDLGEPALANQRRGRFDALEPEGEADDIEPVAHRRCRLEAVAEPVAHRHPSPRRENAEDVGVQRRLVRDVDHGILAEHHVDRAVGEREGGPAVPCVSRCGRPASPLPPAPLRLRRAVPRRRCR